MTLDNERDIQQRIDPALDAHLRDVIRRPSLSSAQHERILARIGLSAATSATTPASERQSLSRQPDHGNATVGPRLNDETPNQGGFSMIPHARERIRDRNQLFELAAVLTVIIVAALAFAIYRDQQDDAPQQIGAPATATETAAPSPTVSETVTVTETEVIVPTPDTGWVYQNLTAEQARDLAPFPIQVPERLPEGMSGPIISVSKSPVVGTDESVIDVAIVVQVGDSFAREQIEYVQSDAPPSSSPGDDATTIDLAGHPVTKWIAEQDDSRPMIVYSWQIDGVYSIVTAVLSDRLPESRVEAFVSAIFGLEGDANTGDASGDGVHYYEDLTPDEAREILPMALLFAEETPAGFDAPAITAEIADQTDGTESFRSVHAVYPLSDDPTYSLDYVQSNQRPQNPPGGDMSTVELGGRTINKALVSSSGGSTIAIYTWNDRGTFATVMTQLRHNLTIELVESFVAATVATSPERHAVSEPVVSSGIEVTVTDVAYPETLDAAPPEGSYYIVVTGTFVNQTFEDEGIWRYLVDRLLNPMLFDESSWNYTHQSATITPLLADLGLNDTATFELVYTVPTGATDLILTFNPDPTTPDDDVVISIPAP